MKRYDDFSRVFNIANQLLKRHAPFAPLLHVDERMEKPSPFSIQDRLSKFSRIMGAKTLEGLYYCRQAVTFKIS